MLQVCGGFPRLFLSYPVKIFVGALSCFFLLSGGLCLRRNRILTLEAWDFFLVDFVVPWRTRRSPRSSTNIGRPRSLNLSAPTCPCIFLYGKRYRHLSINIEAHCITYYYCTEFPLSDQTVMRLDRLCYTCLLIIAVVMKRSLCLIAIALVSVNMLGVFWK